MNILYCGPPSNLIGYLIREGHDIKQTTDPLERFQDAECIISYGYRYKIPQNAIHAVDNRAVNLHISYLPWNRGANPNYWSWYDNTPKGVTIHYIDAGVDTGGIIVQKIVYFDDIKELLTLENTYAKLQKEIEHLFISNWQVLFRLPRIPQPEGGSSHTKANYIYTPHGWKTQCKLVQDIGKVERAYKDRIWLG